MIWQPSVLFQGFHFGSTMLHYSQASCSIRFTNPPSLSKTEKQKHLFKKKKKKLFFLHLKKKKGRNPPPLQPSSTARYHSQNRPRRSWARSHRNSRSRCCNLSCDRRSSEAERSISPGVEGPPWFFDARLWSFCKLFSFALLPPISCHPNRFFWNDNIGESRNVESKQLSYGLQSD